MFVSKTFIMIDDLNPIRFNYIAMFLVDKLNYKLFSLEITNIGIIVF